MASQADVRKFEEQQAREAKARETRPAAGPRPPVDPTQPKQLSVPAPDVTTFAGLPRNVQLMQNAIAQALELGTQPWPEFSAPDSSALTRVLREFSSAADSILNTTKEYVGKAEAAMERGLTAGDQEAAAGKRKLEADKERADRISTATDHFSRMFGVGEYSERIGKLAAEKQRLEDELIQEREQITREMSVGVLDNPIEWFVNQLTLPRKITTFNTKVSQVNSIEAAIESGIAEAQAASTLSHQAIPAITASQQLAAAEVLEAQAAKARANAEVAAADRRIDLGTKQLSVINATVQAESQIFRTKFEASMTQYNARVNALKNAEERAKFRIELANLAESLDDKVTVLGHIRRAEKILGVPQGTYSWTRYKMMSKPDQEAIIGISVGAAGVDPYDAVNTYKHLGVGDQLNPISRQVLGGIQETINGIRAENNYKLQTGKEAQEAYVRSRVNETYGQFLKNPDNPDPKNPYKALRVQQMYDADPVFEMTPAGQALKAYKGTAGNVDTPMIIETILKYHNGDTKAASATLSDYFKRNLVRRDELMQYSQYGLKAPVIPSYPIRYSLPGSDMFSGATVQVDLANPTQVENLLLQITNRRKAQEGYPMPRTQPGQVAPEDKVDGRRAPF